MFRKTQLQTLRAVAAGGDTTRAVANRLLVPLSSVTHRVAILIRDGYIERSSSHRLSLTDKARSLLAKRDELDGYGLGYMQGKGAS